MLDILAITGPIYLTIALGYILTRRGLFAPAEVERLWAEHRAGRRDHSHRLWSLIVLEQWQRMYCD